MFFSFAICFVIGKMLRADWLHRVPDDLERTFTAIQVLDHYNAVTSAQRAAEAPMNFARSSLQDEGPKEPARPVEESAGEAREIQVKSNVPESSKPDARKASLKSEDSEKFQCAVSSLAAMASRASSAGTTTSGNKPMGEVLKSVVSSCLTDRDDIVNAMDPRKDFMTSFVLFQKTFFHPHKTKLK